MSNFEHYKSLLGPELDSLLSFLLLYRLFEWVTSFDQQSGRFNPDTSIELDSRGDSLHRYVSCCNGRPIWAKGRDFVRNLKDSLERPTIQFEKVETKEGTRLYIVIITKTKVECYPKAVNKIYAFGVSTCGTMFYGGERNLTEDPVWEKSAAYRQFLQSIS